MLLAEARRPARVSASGELVALDEQDRAAWDSALIAEGHRADSPAPGHRAPPGPYQILAAINAVHTSAHDVARPIGRRSSRSTISSLRLDPSPIVALNRAIAVGELDGPAVALATVDRLGDRLRDYHAYHATRAALLRRLDRREESREAYTLAIGLAGNSAEIAALSRRRDQLG